MTDRPHAAPRRAERRPIDWRLAAGLLARGRPVAAVVREAGCSARQLSRRRHQDPVFQRWVEEARQAQAQAERERGRIGDLRRVVQEAIEAEVRSGNVRVILWLADRLKLITPPSARTPEQELQDILGALSPAELNEFESLREAV